MSPGLGGWWCIINKFRDTAAGQPRRPPRPPGRGGGGGPPGAVRKGRSPAPLRSSARRRKRRGSGARPRARARRRRRKRARPCAGPKSAIPVKKKKTGGGGGSATRRVVGSVDVEDERRARPRAARREGRPIAPGEARPQWPPGRDAEGRGLAPGEVRSEREKRRPAPRREPLPAVAVRDLGGARGEERRPYTKESPPSLKRWKGVLSKTRKKK